MEVQLSLTIVGTRREYLAFQAIYSAKLGYNNHREIKNMFYDMVFLDRYGEPTNEVKTFLSFKDA